MITSPASSPLPEYAIPVEHDGTHSRYSPSHRNRYRALHLSSLVFPRQIPQLPCAPTDEKQLTWASTACLPDHFDRVPDMHTERPHFTRLFMPLVSMLAKALFNAFHAALEAQSPCLAPFRDQLQHRIYKRLRATACWWRTCGLIQLCAEARVQGSEARRRGGGNILVQS
jgi:hypothetical protein